MAGSTLAETLLGIETFDGLWLLAPIARSTLAETLLGIETSIRLAVWISKRGSTLAETLALLIRGMNDSI